LLAEMEVWGLQTPTRNAYALPCPVRTIALVAPRGERQGKGGVELPKEYDPVDRVRVWYT